MTIELKERTEQHVLTYFDRTQDPAIRRTLPQAAATPEQAVEQLFLQESGERDNLAAINTRHRHALQQALEYLAAARAALLCGESPEFVDVDLRAALDALGSITGRIDIDDILTRVFSTFCLGK